jgi:hypothetical protein
MLDNCDPVPSIYLYTEIKPWQTNPRLQHLRKKFTPPKQVRTRRSIASQNEQRKRPEKPRTVTISRTISSPSSLPLKLRFHQRPPRFPHPAAVVLPLSADYNDNMVNFASRGRR